MAPEHLPVGVVGSVRATGGGRLHCTAGNCGADRSCNISCGGVRASRWGTVRPDRQRSRCGSVKYANPRNAATMSRNAQPPAVVVPFAVFLVCYPCAQSPRLT